MFLLLQKLHLPLLQAGNKLLETISDCKLFDDFFNCSNFVHFMSRLPLFVFHFL